MAHSKKCQITLFDGSDDFILWKKKMKAFLVQEKIHGALSLDDVLDKVIVETKKKDETKGFLYITSKSLGQCTQRNL